MAGNKYVANIGGVLTEVAATQTSAGSADASKIPALDANGLLAATMMPTGVAADTISLVSSDNLAAGDLVNVWNNGGVFTSRKADGSTAGKEAHGFVIAATTSPAVAVVYLSGINTHASGLTAGNVFLSDANAGLASNTAGTGAGHVAQRVGVALSATSYQFQPELPITLA